MCRTLVEIEYTLCDHLVMWEIPSPDPKCNGIRHRLQACSSKICKHCWVSRGFRKKDWKHEGKLPGVLGRLSRHGNNSQIIYLIQDVGLKPTSNCPTWRRRFPWNTRMWAKRQLRLARFAKDMEIDIWFDQDEPPVIPTCYAIDEDTKECTLLEVVPIDDIEDELKENNEKANQPDKKQDKKEEKQLPKEQAKKQREEAKKRDILQNICAICRAPLYGEEDAIDNCSGGGEIARRIPCGNYHVFGLECIIAAWKFSIEGPDQRHCRCPSCRVPLNIQILPPRTYKTRIDKMMKNWHDRYRDGHRPGGSMGPWPIYYKTYAAVSATMIALLPMFMAVNHCMNIHNSKHGGKLPYDQIAVVFLVAAILQIAWFVAMLLSPIILPLYFLWMYRVSIYARFRAVFLSAVAVIKGDYRR